jgi:uncharacterized Zn finger protein (UPF0148 family)
MTAMIVRCGKCRTELEVSGPGEFVCPVCGTRNAVRGAAPGPIDLGGLGGPPPPSPNEGPPPGVTWETCPRCSYRFAKGDVERVSCPNCAAELEVTPEGLKVAT